MNADNIILYIYSILYYVLI